VDHRFARQDCGSSPSPANFSQPTPWNVSGLNRGATEPDRVAPAPWLVTFTDVPFADDLAVFNPATPGPALNPSRLLTTGAVEPAELEFLCDPLVGAKLPPGSIFIPAANDTNGSPSGMVGFVPHTPDVVPVYEVTEQIRDGNVFRIRVKNNGIYPWVDPNIGSRIPGITREQAWPVWIIPPARTGSGNLASDFDTKSPIVGWSSRYMRFPEVP
jgi:hypothetical protein